MRFRQLRVAVRPFKSALGSRPGLLAAGVTFFRGNDAGKPTCGCNGLGTPPKASTINSECSPTFA
jgi:hypothetical protein